jgi:hypothetical protein
MVGPSDSGKHFDASGIPTLAEVRRRSSETDRCTHAAGSSKGAAETLLNDAWLAMRNDASERAQQYVMGAVVMAQVLGVFSPEDAELWQRRVGSCPGHDDEGGRDWCAYCGPHLFSDGG